MVGTFPGSFQTKIQPFIKGKRVVDLGAGDCGRAVVLSNLGATVLAVERQFPKPTLLDGTKDIQTLELDFTSAGKKIDSWMPDVAFVAWPHEEGDQSIVDCLLRCEHAIYIGKNTDVTTCGRPYLFQYLRAREVLVYFPRKQNVLIVYGKHLGSRRTQVHHEEFAGLRQRFPRTPFSRSLKHYEVSDDDPWPNERDQPTTAAPRSCCRSPGSEPHDDQP